MKLKNMFVAAIAALATALPVQARVESQTDDLLRMVSQEGIMVKVNTAECHQYPIHGAYITYGNSRSMVLCPGKRWDAIDHSTVRHEMAHALQHCVNTKRGTPRNTPIISDRSQLAQLVNTYVPEEQVISIKESYPREKWLVEFEANYVELVMTSSSLMQLWDEFGCREVFNV